MVSRSRDPHRRRGAYHDTAHGAGAGLAIEDSVLLTTLLESESALRPVLENFMTRRFERCRMVVDNSFLLGEWEKTPNAPGADPVGVLDKSLKALAQPI